MFGRNEPGKISDPNLGLPGPAEPQPEVEPDEPTRTNDPEQEGLW